MLVIGRGFLGEKQIVIFQQFEQIDDFNMVLPDYAGRNCGLFSPMD